MDDGWKKSSKPAKSLESACKWKDAEEVDLKQKGAHGLTVKGAVCFLTPLKQ